MSNFSLGSSEYIELSKLLKATGCCPTGGAAKMAVVQGLVKVNGQIETRKGCKIRPGQQVEFSGQVITVEQ